MEPSENASIPPEQKKGISKTLEQSVELGSQDEAENFFVETKDRLLDINRWHKITDAIKTHFHLTDRHGNKLNRKAHAEDFVAIDLPAPDNEAGRGPDWVQVEAIEYDDYPDENRELMALRLRPVSNPTNTEDDSTAHFFDEAASSSFVIERIGHTIYARYYGRNEVPNIHTQHLGNTIRNVAVAIGAMLVFSEIQWNNLLKGFLLINKSE